MNLRFAIERNHHHIDEAIERMEYLNRLVELAKQQQRAEQAIQGAMWREFFKLEVEI